MTSREQRRFRLRAALGEQLGDEVAEDLMDSLPPFDWTHIATKDDIRRLEQRFDGVDYRFDNVDQRFRLMDQRFEEQIRLMNQRFELTNTRLDSVKQRFVLMDERFDLLETKLGVKMLRLSVGSTITSVGVLAGLMALLR
ncbi:MAG: hypothetical protein O3C62_00895 [Actinomycetota bacterium]|nr:hypothetical protein [Actinomycetota bacterium]MDA2971654.1 hypothetical protein [Actinomycetota bacterium]MDA3000222.1 hypothetical protein [Actinomycetota bacterium]